MHFLHSSIAETDRCAGAAFPPCLAQPNNTADEATTNMAYATEITTGTQSGLSARFTGLLIDLRARLARRKVYTQTISELQNLSDRELADLGLNRSIIRRVAFQAAYEV